MTLSPRFLATFTDIHGEAGRAWLSTLPRLRPAIEARFGVRLLGLLPRLSYNLLWWAEAADGAPLVVKAMPPGAAPCTEARALRAYAGWPTVRLLDHWPAAEALLLERALPGHALSQEPHDRRALAAVATVAPASWIAPPAPESDASAEGGAVGSGSTLGASLPRIADWAAGLKRLRERHAGGTGPLDSRLVAKAEDLFKLLLASAPPERLLHGDLHYGNVLAATRRPWLLVDPSGVLGEPAWDAGYLVANASPQLRAAPDPRRLLAERLAFVPAAFGLDPARVAAYAFAAAVLSAWWSLEDHGKGWERSMQVAALLEEWV